MKFIFFMKSGGRLKAAWYEEQGEEYSVQLSVGGSMKLKKADVEKIEKVEK